MSTCSICLLNSWNNSFCILKDLHSVSFGDSTQKWEEGKEGKKGGREEEEKEGKFSIIQDANINIDTY